MNDKSFRINKFKNYMYIGTFIKLGCNEVYSTFNPCDISMENGRF